MRLGGLFTLMNQELGINFFGTHVHFHSILIWGFIATGLLTAVMETGQKFGWSRMSIPYLLGTAFTPNQRRAFIYGFLVHFLNGWLFALLYGFAFEDTELATWWFGSLLGLTHAILLLTGGMRLLTCLHPHIAYERYGPNSKRWLQPPGFLAMNYGRRTPMVTVAAHLLFGAILGSGYQLLSVAH